MKTTLGWLRRHLETEAPVAAVAERLVGLGHEVEDIQDRAAELAPFTVAYVIEAVQHPNADRLRVCRVDTGKGEVQVVCGAPNARTGMKGVFAPSGTTIPGTGLKLKPSEIRGVKSNGMLCSEREMGLGENHDGIIDLPADAPVGAPFAEVMGLGDPILDLKVTPDRGDCLGVRGLARDLAAGGLGRLKPYEIAPIKGRFKSAVNVHLRLPAEAAHACPLFVGRQVRGVANGESPRWLKDKLVAAGLRPISALVDITNWLTLDLNRPAHVFDVAKLKGDIQVRLGRAGESLSALNGRTYALDDAMTAIADDAGPLGLGGIIGGEPSGCSAATTDVFVEIALFDPLRTAATGRRLGIESDARYRFERGVDPAFVVPGMEEATRLILELCGGEPSELVIAGSTAVAAKSLALRPARIRSLGGLDVGAAEARKSLEALGCTVDATGGETWSVGLPTWRHDLLVEGDLVEEVLRLHSFDAIPAVSLPRVRPLTQPMLTTRQMRARWAKRTYADRGLVEAVTYSFLPRAHAELFSGGNGPNPELRLTNPISADLDWMRPSTLPNLLAAAGRNHARGQREAALFEVGPAYADATPAGQGLVAGAVRRGDTGPRHWRVKPRAVDALDAKADALAVLAACGLAGGIAAAAGAPAWYHPGRSGQLRLGNIVVAEFGELHPRVLAALDVPGPAVGCEVFLDRIPEPKAKGSRTRPALDLSPFQPVERDFAFVVGEGVAAEAIVKAARGVDRALIADAAVFDVYRGKGLPEGKVSLALSVTLQPTKATLTDAEIEAVAQKIVDAVAKATGATLRT